MPMRPWRSAHAERFKLLDLGLLLRQTPLDEAALIVSERRAQETAITGDILTMGDESDCVEISHIVHLKVVVGFSAKAWLPPGLFEIGDDRPPSRPRHYARGEALIPPLITTDAALCGRRARTPVAHAAARGTGKLSSPARCRQRLTGHLA